AARRRAAAPRSGLGRHAGGAGERVVGRRPPGRPGRAVRSDRLRRLSTWIAGGRIRPMHDAHRFRGELRIELRDRDGRPVLARACRNTVVRSGAELIGALFAGTALTPVNGMSVGTNAQPSSAPYEVSALTAA